MKGEETAEAAKPPSHCCHLCAADFADIDVLYHYARNHGFPARDIPHVVLEREVTACYERIGVLTGRRSR